MHTLALLASVVAQVAPPPGMLTIGEGVALAIGTAIVSVSVTYATTRQTVADLVRRVTELEETSKSTARLEERVGSLHREMNTQFEGLRRELHNSGVYPAKRGDG